MFAIGCGAAAPAPPAPPAQAPPAAACASADTCARASVTALARADKPAALDLASRACDLGDVHSCVRAGVLALELHRTDSARIVEVERRACRAGNQEGCTVLATLYFQGLGVRKEPERAVVMLADACTAGLLDACGNLGVAYLLGMGVAEDHAKAVANLTRACEHEAGDYCRMLALAWSGGDADERARAAPALQHQCDAGEVNSCFELAILYKHGTSVPVDLDRALELAHRACNGGLAEACDALAKQQQP